MSPSVAARSEPALSLVVAVHNMRREAARTLQSLTATYQRGIDSREYEVLVVENGSREPLDREWVEGLGPSFRYRFVDTRSPSPAAGINQAVREARAPLVGISIDGARMFSPGLLARVLQASRVHSDVVIATLSWHLGPDMQWKSVRHGYSQEMEDRLLDSISWREDGYRLFEVSTLAGSSRRGLFQPLAESNCLFMNRAAFDELGGLDERFDQPGGGLVNHDLYRRACERPGAELVLLLGEGTFHQLHGGVTTNASELKREALAEEFNHRYEELRGRPYERPTRTALYFGSVPQSFLTVLKQSAELVAPSPAPNAVRHWFRRLLRRWLRSHHASPDS